MQFRTIIVLACAVGFAKAKCQYCQFHPTNSSSKCDFSITCEKVPVDSGVDFSTILNSCIHTATNGARLCVQMNNEHIFRLVKGFIGPTHCFSSEEDSRCVVDLQLENNDIASIDQQAFFEGGENAEQLISLSLARNKMLANFEFGELFGGFISLADLDLSSNELSSFPKVLPPNLENLNMAGNAIKDFFSEALPKSLKTLNLSFNLIRNWQGLNSSLEFKNLSSLDLSNNRLTRPDLAELYKLMPSLTWIGLLGNPLICDENLCFLQQQMLNLSLDHDNPVCQEPASAKGTPLTDAQLNCRPAAPADSMTIIAITTSVAVIFFLGLIALGLVWMQKNGRLLFIRRNQRKAEDYVYDGPGLDTFELESRNE